MAAAMWDPGQYQRFADERGRPFFDLLTRVRASDPGYVVDLGCGPGNLTAALSERWPGADVVGVDNSPEMIGAAQAEAAPRLSFALGDLRGRRGPDPVTEWYRGTGLRPVLAALGPGQAEEFVADYGKRVREAYPPAPYGTVLPFRRVFVVARRTGA